MSSLTAKDRLIVALDMPTIEEAQRLIARLGNEVTFYKVGLELLFCGGLELARALKAEGKRVFLDMKLLDIGNTVERAVANATELGVDFLTVHGHDLKTLRAAVSGRGNSKLKLLAVTVLTNLTADDLGSAIVLILNAAWFDTLVATDGFCRAPGGSRRLDPPYKSP